MKKNLFLISILILCFSCKKNEIKEPTEPTTLNTVQMISDAKGLFGVLYASLGHSGTNCPGCVASGGQHIHLDCQGPGNACQIRITMSLVPTRDGAYYGIVTNPDDLTSNNTFLMPNRSFYIIDSSGEFLNIPEQTVYRDEENETFMFYDIFFSEWQMFGNE